MTYGSASSARLNLPQVTLCAVSSVNVMATVQALERSLSQVEVAAALLLTDKPVQLANPNITVVPIAPITSSQRYSEFILSQLVDYIDTSYCLLIQWDGHVLDAARWLSEFLNYDYIGASWPQFDDGHDVGNGGFSLRSHRLMQLCRDPRFQPSHPEDVAIGRLNRNWLEREGMKFAPRGLADRFSAERAGDITSSFGYHGAWLMPEALGVEGFWALYRDLDDRGTLRHDFSSILRHIWRGRRGWIRALRLLLDQFRR